MPARSGQITVTTSGTAVQGTDVTGHMFAIAADPANTETVWVGEDGSAGGDVTVLNGFPLSPGAASIILMLNNLNDLWFDVNVSGEKICWIQLD
jgi:hypothetical protein